MLKKTVSAIFVGLLIAATSASAAININYEALGGMYRSDDTTGLTEPANGSQTALVQLIYTPNNSYGLAGVGGAVEGIESVLQQVLITDSGGTDPYGSLASTPYSGTYQPGYLYVRIFDQGTGLGGAGVVVGTWYYNGPIVATIDNLVPESPDNYIANQGTSSAFPGADFLNLQVVPEPASLALMGLGGLLFAIRRRFVA